MSLRQLLIVCSFLSLFFSNQIWADVQVIAKTGWTVPGFPTHFNYSDLEKPVIGPAGHVAFSGTAFDGRMYIKAVWAGLPGQLEAIIQENETISGFPANILFSNVDEGTFLINRSGGRGFPGEIERGEYI